MNKISKFIRFHWRAALIILMLLVLLWFSDASSSARRPLELMLPEQDYKIEYFQKIGHGREPRYLYKLSGDIQSMERRFVQMGLRGDKIRLPGEFLADRFGLVRSEGEADARIISGISENGFYMVVVFDGNYVYIDMAKS